MSDENSNKDEGATRASGSERVQGRDAGRSRLPEPVERAGFAIQERVLWPLQDRFTLLGPGPSRAVLGGAAALAVVAVAAVAIALSSGGGPSKPSTVAVETADTREPLAATVTSNAAEPEPQDEPPRKTLHGAAPVFSPPSPASRGGEKTGKSKAVDSGAAGDEAPDPGGAAAASDSAGASGSGSGDSADSSSADSTSPSPAAATISSDRKGSNADKSAGPTAGTAAARAPVPAGPPAGPAALKVAREFAQGFVVYETGGEKADYGDAFAAAATPELTKALLRRPPKQPAGVTVPRAKVLNVVAGPSRGQVYKVSVSLLRVGVTSELRLDMERVKTADDPAGEQGKRLEWRVTNVLG